MNLRTNLFPIQQQGYDAREQGLDKSDVPYWLPWHFTKRGEWLRGWWRRQCEIDCSLPARKPKPIYYVQHIDGSFSKADPQP